MEINDTKDFKRAAERLQDHLQPHGIRLKQGLALEALSASFGEFNWRKVRSKLQGTSQRTAPDEHLPLKGYAYDRVTSGQERFSLEAAFVKAWTNLDQPHTPHPLTQLIPNCSTEQAQAASTVIQWLGSDVGSHFVLEVLRSQGWRIAGPHTGPRWLVNGIYKDNHQRWADSFGGSTALEAQIFAQMDRLADAGWITAIEVASVVDQLTGEVADEESYTGDVQLLPMGNVLKKVTSLARAHQSKPPSRGVELAEAWDAQNAALEFWEKLAAGNNALKFYLSSLDDLLESGPEEEEDGLGDIEFTDSRGVEMDLNAAESLTAVLDLAEKGMDTSDTSDAQRTGVFQILQLRAFLEYFEDALNGMMDGCSA